MLCFELNHQLLREKMNFSRVNFNREANALEYERFPKIKPSLLDVVLLLITYPGFLLMGSILIVAGSCDYFKYKKKQIRLLNILTDDSALKRYQFSRLQATDAKIAKLKRKAEEHIQTVIGTGCLAGTEFPLLTKNWTTEHWKNFGKTDFLALAAKQLPAKINALALNMKAFVDCDEYRRRIGALIAQKELFQRSTLTEEIVVARRIAEMSYVKTIFKKQCSLNQLRAYAWMLVPLGLLRDCTRRAAPYLITRHIGFHDEQVFRDRSNDLFLIPSLTSRSANLVEVHNALLKENPYLMPYIP